jgi:peptidoglycan/LPS O-acetylase OafA/YrhL
MNKASFYQPELDALRFFAFVMVFVAHLPRFTSPWLLTAKRMGGFGMCVFFALSAFLIVTLLLRERESSGTINIKGFAARRVLRIWPLYFAVLLISYLIGTIWVSVHFDSRALWFCTLLVGNLWIIHHGWALGVAGPLWSLSVEEQFYLGIPFLTRIAGRRGLLVICLLTIPLSYVALAYESGIHANPATQIWVNSFVQFQFFALGGLIALWNDGRKMEWGYTARAASFVFGVFLWFIAIYKFAPEGESGLHVLMPSYLCTLAGVAFVFLSVLNLQMDIPRWISYLGQISYGLYVFHDIFLWGIFRNVQSWPMTSIFEKQWVIGAGLALFATIGTAAISYRYFESPILRYKRRFATESSPA